MNDEDGRRTSTVTVLFCDLVASTERQSRLGDDAHDEFRSRFFPALTACVHTAHGEVVKNTGDGLMVVFRHSSADAVACAIAMHREVDALDDDDPVAIYIGISAGEAAEEEGDWFGTPVNEAARLCAAAKPGQTLTNEVVRALVGSRGNYGFRSVGSITLKGLPAPVAAVEVLRTDGSAPAGVVAETTVTAVRRGRPRKPIGIGIVIAVVLAAIAGTVAVVAGGGSDDNRAQTPTAGATAPNYPVHYAVQRCPADQSARIPSLQCGLLTVPENRAKPNGRTVRLDVYRAPARGSAKGGDPVVDFGADDLASSPARDQHEEIQVAQRGWSGTPGSNPALTCPEYTKIAAATLTKPSGDAVEVQRKVDAFRACHDRLARLGVDLSGYDYVTVGDDVADLIQQLHLKHVNIISGYVATIGALEVARRLPGVVRTLTLQTPVPGGRSGSTDPTRYLSAAFNSYVALCNADAVCKSTFPNLPAALRHDYDVYRTQPHLARSADNNGVERTVVIDGPRVAQAIYAGLNDSRDYAVLAAGIAANARTPDIDSLTANRILSFNSVSFDPTFAWGAQLSGQCSYDVYTVDSAHTLSSNAVPELSGLDDGFLKRVCAVWKVDRIASVAFDDPNTEVPTLVVGGGLSPGADPDWPDQFQRTLANGTVARFPTLSAAVLNSNDPKCVAILRRKFLADPNAPLEIDACEVQSPKIHFVGST